MTTDTMTADEYNSLVAEQKKSKYRNVKTVVDGITFDSKAEAKRYGELKLMQDAGQIANLERQRRFELVVNGVKVCTYVADFCYHERIESVWWPFVVEDVKGMRTPAYKLKRRLMKACHDIDVQEIER